MINVVVTELSPLFTLEEAKQHLRVEHGDDDGLIQTYMDAAVRHVLMYCNLPLVPQEAEPQFKVAALMLTGEFYDNRSAVAPGPVASVPLSASVQALINPYRYLRV